MHPPLFGCLLFVATSASVVIGAAILPRATIVPTHTLSGLSNFVKREEAKAVILPRHPIQDEQRPSSLSSEDDDKIAIDKKLLYGAGTVVASGFAAAGARVHQLQRQIKGIRAEQGYGASMDEMMTNKPTGQQVLELNPQQIEQHVGINNFEIEIKGDVEVEEMYQRCKKSKGLDEHTRMHLKFQNFIKQQCINIVQTQLRHRRRAAEQIAERERAFPPPNWNQAREDVRRQQMYEEERHQEQQQPQQQHQGRRKGAAENGRWNQNGGTLFSLARIRHGMVQVGSQLQLQLQRQHHQHQQRDNAWWSPPAAAAGFAAAVATATKNIKVQPISIPIKGPIGI